MFLAAKSNNTSVGRLYVIQLILDTGEIIHKIGMCHSARSTDRLFEILRSWFNVHRYSPRADIRLDMKTEIPLLLEKYVHFVFEDYKYTPDKKSSGFTEMFIGLDEDKLIHYLRFEVYEDLLDEDLTEKERAYALTQIIEDVPY